MLFEQSVFWVVSIAQLVEVTDSAVLGGVAEVEISNSTVGHKNIFQHLPAYVIYFISPINLYQLLILSIARKYCCCKIIFL